MTNEESLRADRELAANIIATIYDHDSAGMMPRAELYERFREDDADRIDVILSDLADAGFLGADEDTLFLAERPTLAELGAASSAVCRCIAKRAIT